MTPDQLSAELELSRRTGWPEHLRLLLERYPREVWPSHANLGHTAQFWLQRHDMFRGLGQALRSGTNLFREGEVALPAFRSWMAPRLQHFLSDLHAHHQIEDLSYFPIMRTAEPRLIRGFEVLENDHVAIHGSIERLAHETNAFLGEDDPDRLRTASDRFSDAGDALLSGLLRHLDDEEDLIIPLILDRSEGGLGIG